MANFISSLSGSALNDALQQVEARIPEGWAVGTYDGVAVGSNSPYFHNNAKYYAALAQSAVPSGTSGALFWNVDQSATLSNANKAQARKNIMAGGSNPNLLDNPWFTVNQRGNTSVTATGSFICDRWKKNYGTGTATWSSDRVTFTATNECSFVQNFPTLLAGTYTASVLLQDNTIKVITFNSTRNLVIASNWTLIVSLSKFEFYHNASSNEDSIAVRAVKIEKGSFSTLANDTQPDQVAERNKCQYYAEMVDNASNNNLSLGYAMCTDSETIYMPFTIKPKRTAPSVTLTGAIKVGVRSYDITATDVSVYSFSPKSGHGTLKITASGVTLGQLYRVGLTAGGKLLFSADL